MNAVLHKITWPTVAQEASQAPQDGPGGHGRAMGREGP